jgi:hypothetical protein
MPLFKKWLSFAQVSEVKMEFMVSLRKLLEKEELVDLKLEEFTHRLFSNMTTSGTMPAMGKDSDSLDLMINLTNCPFEEEQEVGLDILGNLSSFAWGCRAMYANENVRAYIFDRAPSSQLICQKKYRVVTESIKSCTETKGLVDEETAGNLLKYQAGGVYGEMGTNDP